jgi:cytochrome P450
VKAAEFSTTTSAEEYEAAYARAYNMPLEEINPSDTSLYATDTYRPFFERLRKEDPVHRSTSPKPEVGQFWSITRYKDIVAVDKDFETFTSEGNSVLDDRPDNINASMFIMMDGPRHDEQRKVVSPPLSPASMARNLAPLVRERAAKILDSLPVGEEFDWVEKVSTELTTMTLATLFDFPWEERRKLTDWSEIAIAYPDGGMFGTTDFKEHHLRRAAHFQEAVEFFAELVKERAKCEPKNDLISLLAHSESTKNLELMNFVGMLMLLLVGGNDTTRNTISGSVLALHQHPDQYDAVGEDPAAISRLVSESIRWQTPLLHVRRTATRDVELGGKKIREGDKVAIWYISGNRDEEVFPDADRLWIERPNVRSHMSFGFGVHRCLGNRLAELQIQIVWEEILKRYPRIDVVGPAERTLSLNVHGITRLPVVIPSRISS